MLSTKFAKAQHLPCRYLLPLRKWPWIPESPWQSDMRVSGDVVRTEKTAWALSGRRLGTNMDLEQAL